MTVNASKYAERERDLPNIKGLSFREIAARWGVTETRVRQVLWRLTKRRATKGNGAAK